MAKVNEETIQRTERIMAYVLLVAVGLSVISFFAIIIGTWNGMSAADFGTGMWPAVAATPYIGLPVAILLILALVLSSARRRARTARDNAK